MARAVAGWSPVISTGVMPAAWQAAMVAAADGRGGSRMRDQAEQPQARVPAPPRSAAASGRSACGDRQDPEAVAGQLLGARAAAWSMAASPVGQRSGGCSSGLGRALADDADAAAGQLVHGGHPLAVAVERHLGDAREPAR